MRGLQRQCRALLCLKNILAKVADAPRRGKKSLLTVKWICPIHAEPVQYLTGRKRRMNKMKLRKRVTRNASIALLMVALFLACVWSPLSAAGQKKGWDLLPEILSRIVPPTFPDRDFNVTDQGRRRYRLQSCLQEGYRGVHEGRRRACCRPERDMAYERPHPPGQQCQSSCYQRCEDHVRHEL